MCRRAAIRATMTTGIAIIVLLAPPLHAQLVGGLPTGGALDPGAALGQVRDGVKDALDDLATPLVDPLAQGVHEATSLARERLRRLTRFVSRHRDSVAWDEDHQPAVRGEVLLLDPDAAALTTAKDAGYTVIENATLDGLGVRYARLRTPDGMPLARAVEALRKALPGHDVSADQLHFPAGTPAGSTSSAAGRANRPLPSDLPRGGTAGVIDGGFGTGSPQSAPRVVAQRGFAQGAPRASDHAAAIASLLAGAGTARLYGADVYGSDPAGGNALAIARALGWMLQQAVPVVSISLVGPANPLLARAVAAAQQRGMTIVAAVGNDGAAAPPAYPASYPGVIAVTGIDGAGRVLIEAGRATHLDYAAPGADMTALVPGRGRIDLRGTSYAAPLVASRIAARRQGGADAGPALHATDAEALSGRRNTGRSETGRGVLCNICRSGL